MVDNTLLILMTGLTTLGGTIVTALLQVYRDRAKAKLEERNRAWDLEDRQEKAATVLHETKKNTEISQNAFHEANQTNLKISATHDRIDGVVKDTKKALSLDK